MPRILIVDDQELIRRGIQGLLADAPWRCVFGEAATGFEALAMIRQEHWDAAVLDLSLSGQDPLELLRQLKAAAPKTPVIVLNLGGGIPFALLAFRSGASASIPKRSAGHDLLPAMQYVLTGRRYIQPDLAEQLAEEMLTGDPSVLHTRLTTRELEVLRRLATGFSSGAIAEVLCISAKTVSTHRRNILKKLHLTNNAELILYAIRHDLVEV